jgi:hypothetical protein
VEAGRARVVAEEAAAAEAVKAAEAAERMQLEEQAAALTLQLQQVQAQPGVPPAAPAPHPDDAEDLCVVCFDAPKDHIMLPCFHMCVCEACASLLTQMRSRRAPSVAALSSRPTRCSNRRAPSPSVYIAQSVHT